MNGRALQCPFKKSCSRWLNFSRVSVFAGAWSEACVASVRVCVPVFHTFNIHVTEMNMKVAATKKKIYFRLVDVISTDVNEHTAEWQCHSFAFSFVYVFFYSEFSNDGVGVAAVLGFTRNLDRICYDQLPHCLRPMNETKHTKAYKARK